MRIKHTCTTQRATHFETYPYVFTAPICVCMCVCMHVYARLFSTCRSTKMLIQASSCVHMNQKKTPKPKTIRNVWGTYFIVGVNPPWKIVICFTKQRCWSNRRCSNLYRIFTFLETTLQGPYPIWYRDPPTSPGKTYLFR